LKGINMSSTDIYNEILTLTEPLYHRVKKRFLMKEHPKLLNIALSLTPHLTEKSPLAEILFCLKNTITERPKCSICNGPVRFIPGGNSYYDICGSVCSIVRTRKKYGVTNISQLQSTKDKIVEKCEMKYGVSNPAKIPDVGSIISKKKTEYWARVFPNNRTSEDITLSQYRKLVKGFTYRTFRKYPDLIDPDNKHSYDFQIDHIVSVAFGYKNDIPPEIIGHFENLRIIPSMENQSKNWKSDMTVEELYEKYNSSTKLKFHS
jgi:hypothetical protein